MPESDNEMAFGKSSCSGLNSLHGWVKNFIYAFIVKKVLILYKKLFIYILNLKRGLKTANSLSGIYNYMFHIYLLS